MPNFLLEEDLFSSNFKAASVRDLFQKGSEEGARHAPFTFQ